MDRTPICHVKLSPLCRLCRQIVVVSLLCPLASSGCDDADPHNRGVAPRTMRVAVTTSTLDSGLLDTLIPTFETQRGVRVDMIAVGTGKALKLGESNDVDVLLVHSRIDEDAFMAAGHGTRRENVMYNYFELLGPPSDPAGVRGTAVTEALTKIFSGRHRFISRGDASGTHKRELALWQLAGIQAQWDEYIETGQGMGSSLIIANQREGYILSDRGTYLRFQAKVDLIPIIRSSEDMRNPYGIIVVNPQTTSFPSRLNLANAFVDFFISPRTQRAIGEFRINGERLFHPLQLP